SSSRFYTYDITKPIITNITYGSVTSSGATITWTTDELANSTVYYGTTTATISTSGSASLTNSSSITLSSLSSSTLYYYNVSSCDAAGNCNTSSQYNFTTSAADSGSSGGGGGTPSVTYDEQTVGTLAAGSTKAIAFTKSATLAVTEITVTVKNKVTNAKIKVDAGSLPSGASVPSSAKGSVYKYITITKTAMTDDDVSKGIIKFKVKKEWLTDKGYGKDTVALHRYYTNKWTKLTTTRDSEDTTDYYYSAESPGFSTFAITAEEAPAVITPPAEEVPEEEAPEEVPEEVPGEELEEMPEEPEEETKSNTTLIVALIAVVIVLAVVGYFVWKKKKY
ncbi:PGF-pre-PGF domain-containing protein, partial [Candidatus Woesearchaeota archaeon]|nr:PGF-pre-PGF domain-containing protein [Candidatus Woesearchaeota archaeon]